MPLAAAQRLAVQPHAGFAVAPPAAQNAAKPKLATTKSSISVSAATAG